MDKGLEELLIQLNCARYRFKKWDPAYGDNTPLWVAITALVHGMLDPGWTPIPVLADHYCGSVGKEQACFCRKLQKAGLEVIRGSESAGDYPLNRILDEFTDPALLRYEDEYREREFWDSLWVDFDKDKARWRYGI